MMNVQEPLRIGDSVLKSGENFDQNSLLTKFNAYVSTSRKPHLIVISPILNGCQTVVCELISICLYRSVIPGNNILNNHERVLSAHEYL